jgi:hypothetical protein
VGWVPGVSHRDFVWAGPSVLGTAALVVCRLLISGDLGVTAASLGACATFGPAIFDIGLLYLERGASALSGFLKRPAFALVCQWLDYLMKSISW